ncbi:hypothetical protein BON30_28250 [Cystobacter ferrugineus]|uniref:Uncharacterized protein n=1 Tax=Cystobacter ferrugineus TaxID=83449 RepID=A0A1L9B4M1_9BACT|nr:hypothetical protein BON30_28250 [Cystobacter ferrugineus]
MDEEVFASREGWPDEVRVRRVGNAFVSDVMQLEADAQGRAWVLRRDKDSSLRSHDEGRSFLEVYSQDGRLERTLKPLEGAHLVRFVLHPSGELTLFELRRESNQAFYDLYLRRLSANGETLVERRFEDPGRPGENLSYEFDGSRNGDVMNVEVLTTLGPGWSHTRFLGPLKALALGEDVVFSVRVYGVKLYRLTPSLELAWDTQVMPHHDNLLLIGAEQLALDGEGNLVVAFDMALSEARAYQRHFQRALQAREDGSIDVAVLRFSAHGAFIDIQLHGGAADDLLEAMAIHAGEVVLVARNRLEKFDIPNDTLEFDLVLMRASLREGALLLYRQLDLAREDYPRAVVVDGEGRIYVGGNYDYAQADSNSQVDYGKGLLVRLDWRTGEPLERLSLSGPRDVQLWHLALRPDGRMLFAGIYDAPHSHTADQDASLSFNRGMLGTITLQAR